MNNDVNLGIVIALRDAFSMNARNIENAYSQLDNGLASASQSIQKSMKRIQTGLALTGAGVVALASLRAPVKFASEFQHAMTQVSTLVDTAVVDMAQLETSVKELSSMYGADPTKQATALYDVMSAGIEDAVNATYILDVANKTAIGGVADLNSTIKGLTATMMGYGLSVDKASGNAEYIADLMFKTAGIAPVGIEDLADSIGMVIPLAKTMGLTLEEVFGTVGTISLGGKNTSESVTGLRQMLDSLVKPSKEAKKYVEDFNKSTGSTLSLSSDAIAEKGLYNFLMEIKDAFGDNKEAIAAIFPQVEGFQAVLSLTGAQAEDFKRMLDSITDSAGSMEVAFQKMQTSAKTQWDILVANLKILAINVGTVVLQIATPVLKVLNKITQALVKFTEEFPTVTKVVVGAIVAFGTLATAVGLFNVALGAVRLVIPIMNWMLRSLGIQATVTGAMIKSALTKAFLPLAIGIGTVSIFKKAWDADIGGIQTKTMSFGQKVGLVWKGLTELIKSTKDGVGEMSAGTKQALEEAGLLDTVITLYMWWYRFDQFWQGFKDGFISSFTEMGSGIMSFLEPVFNVLGNAITKAEEFLVSIGLLKPTPESATAWYVWGQRVGAIVSVLAYGWIVGKLIRSLDLLVQSAVSVGKFLASPFRLAWSAVSSLWGIIGRGVGIIGNVWRSIVSLGETLYIVWLYAQPYVMQFLNILSKVFNVGRLIGQAFMWVAGVIASALGISVGWVLALVAVIVGAVVAVVYFWDEIVLAFNAVVEWFSTLPGIIGGFIDSVVEWFASLPGLLAGAFNAVIDWFASLPGVIGDFLSSLPSILYDAFVTAISWAFVGLLVGIGLIWQGISLIGEYFVIGMQWVGETVWAGMQLAWQYFVMGITWLGETAWAGLQLLWNYFVQGMMWIGQTVWDGLLAIWNFFTVTLPNIAVMVFNWIVTELPGYVMQGMAWIYNLFVTGLQSIWTFFTVTLPQIASLVFNWIVTELPGYVGQGVNAMITWFSTLPEGIGKWLSTLWDNFMTWGGNLINWFTGLPGQLWSAISGGLTKLGSDILGKINGILDGLPGWAKKALNGIGFSLDVETSDSGGKKTVKVPGASTGGYIPKEGLVNLHPGEVVVNHALTTGLKELLDGKRAVNAQSVSRASESIEYTIINNNIVQTMPTGVQPTSQYNPSMFGQTSTTNDSISPVQEANYVERLITSKETHHETNNSSTTVSERDSSDRLLESKFDQMLTLLAKMAERPLQGQVVLNGRELTQSVLREMELQNERRYR